MAPEHEQNQERKEDKKKEKKSFPDILFRELIEKIKEISRRLKQPLAKEEENILSNELRRCTAEEERRKTEFFQQPGFGQQTYALREQLRRNLKRKTDEWEASDPQERPQKAKELSDAIDRARQEAAKHWLSEPENLKASLKDIAETELEEALEHFNRFARKVQTKDQAATPPFSRESAMNNVRQTAEDIGRIYEQSELAAGKTPEEAKQSADQLVDNIIKQGSGFGRGFKPEEVRALTSADDIYDTEKDSIFNDLFQQIDMWPNEFFSQAFSGMGLEMMNKVAEYRRLLGEIPGEKGQQIINEFMAKFKAKQMLHDAVCGIEQGRANPEVFKDMMEGFTPELFDQLFIHPEEEVALAAHLYEVGMTTERSKHENWIPADYVFYDPREKGSKLNKWVRERFKEIIKAKYDYDDKAFENEWPEQRIQRALAAGKGYEMVTLRMPELVARGRLKQPDKNMLVSPPYEDFVRPLDPFESLVEKFQGYDDPGAHFLLYLITGERIAGSSREQINELLKKKFSVDPASLRLIDMVNFFGIGGPFSRTPWRGQIITDELFPENRQWMGLSFRLANAESLAKDQAKEQGKNWDEMKKEEQNKFIREVKKPIFLEELKRNPLGILREAELQPGEIFDPEVSERVRKKVGLNKDEDKEKIEKIENALILLTQLEADPKLGRQKEIDFSKITDPETQRLARAYYEAIKEVMGLKVDWRKWHGQKPGDTLIDYLAAKDIPFAPAFDDTPWGEFKFSKMGQKGFARRARDFNAGNNSFKALNGLQADFGKLRKTDDLIREMDELWKAMRDYDKKGATGRMKNLYEGIGHFNAGNFWKRFLPIPLDGVPDALSDAFGTLGFKSTSYAKEVYGMAANSWRGIDLRNYLSKARLAGHITKKDENELRGKLKCSFGWVAAEFLARAGPLGIGLIAYTFLKELGEQLQEQVKEQG